MKKEFSPYTSFSFEKIDSPKKKTASPKATKFTPKKDPRAGGRNK